MGTLNEFSKLAEEGVALFPLQRRNLLRALT